MATSHRKAAIVQNLEVAPFAKHNGRRGMVEVGVEGAGRLYMVIKYRLWPNAGKW
jgi:hypothetical protein